MPILLSESLNPYFNLATEEYLLKSSISEDIFFIWKANKAFVFGRNQNPFAEIHPDYFKKDIPIIRRISGGGTVFIDESTLNFCYITSNYHKKINDYEHFLRPIIKALNSLGFEIEFKPKSHLFIKDKKISGNAQAFVNKKLLHHGTILYDADLSVIDEALIKHNSNIEGLQIKSNKQSVINLKDVLNESNIDEITNALINEVASQENFNRNKICFSSDEIREIEDLSKNKYQSPEWNFGKTPLFQTRIEYKNRYLMLKIDKGKVTFVDNNKFDKLIGLYYYSEEYFIELEKILKI